jgi:hypothetical protein
MLKQKKQQFDSENLVDLLEKMIDLRYKMLKETDHCNYRESCNIEEKQYTPIVEQLKLGLNRIKK